MKRVTVVVTGLVQGVSFRYYTRREAKQLGLTGWVRNEADGTVTVVAEGQSDSLRDLLRFLGKGPPAARVRNIEANWTPASGEFVSFEVRFG